MNDEFQLGMHILAVDDDRTCLKILERLLEKCQYHVTTAPSARMALNLLRENKNIYNLVMSNVHMPDMDGFKLLELVGLEMDLPVIMFSEDDDPKMVMKAIDLGACDYLLKPVALKELKMIWQHVIRKKKTSKRSNHDVPNSDSGNGTKNSDKIEMPYRKRKDKNEDDIEEEDEYDHENDGPTAPKKPRFRWSDDLHHKFLVAVNQFGIEKARPQKILNLMNVENLTKEHVASHLQKYRQKLKSDSYGKNHEANMVASGSDTSHPRIDTPPSVNIHELATLDLNNPL